ncbi:MAG: aquaporin, partial [Candidatus Nanopelagicaceae bacterium]
MKVASEAFGTMFLVFAVVGSGMMAESLTDDVALRLLINSAATVAMLYILINLLAPLSGAHFNPVVTLVSSFLREKNLREVTLYLV